MKKNIFKAKLKEMGVTEYQLRKFRKSQKLYSQYYDEIKQYNKRLLGEGTQTRLYDYESLYNRISYSGAPAKTTIKNIIAEQQSVVTQYITQSTTNEVMSYLLEAVNAINQLTGIKTLTLENATHKFVNSSPTDQSKIIDTIQEFLKMLQDYSEWQENEDFKYIILNRYSILISELMFLLS